MLFMLKYIAAYMAANLIALAVVLIFLRLAGKKHYFDFYDILFASVLLIPMLIVGAWDKRSDEEWRNVYHYKRGEFSSCFYKTFQTYANKEWRVVYEDGLYFQVRCSKAEHRTISNMMRKELLLGGEHRDI